MRALLFVTLLLAGCADRAINACPFPVNYDQDTLNRAADEVGHLPLGSPLGNMMTDYAQERAKLRECHK